jgi:uncharacterized protein YndB with AHSA1/START domain
VPAFTRSITIRRSPEQVYAVLDDLEQAPGWMPSIRRIDVLTPGMKIGVGFKWRETRRMFGILRIKMVLVVTAHDPPRTWGLTYNDGKVQATATFELAATVHGTQVSFVEDVEDLQGNAKRAARMFKSMEKQDRDLLDRLKAHVEATTEEPAGLLPEPKVVEAPASPSPVKAGKAAKPAKAKAKPAKAAAKGTKKAAKKR